MADELRLPPEQLKQVAQIVLEGMRGDIQALLKATATPPAIPPPGRPPIDFDGLDARQMDRLKSDLLRDAKDFVRGEIEDFLPASDIEARDRRSTEAVAGQIKEMKSDLLREVGAVVHDEVEKLRVEIFEIFDDMDMPLEKGDKRKATRDKLESLWAMQKGSKEFKAELWKSIRNAAIGWITAAFMGAIAWIGYRGGQH